MSDTTTTHVDPDESGRDHADRIRASAHRCEELDEALRLEIERRDQLIVEGADVWGMTKGEIARCCGRSRSRVIALLART